MYRKNNQAYNTRLVTLTLPLAKHAYPLSVKYALSVVRALHYYLCGRRIRNWEKLTCNLFVIRLEKTHIRGLLRAQSVYPFVPLCFISFAVSFIHTFFPS